MNSFLATLAFLTRLPMARQATRGQWSPTWFPAAGLVVGLLLAGAAGLLTALPLALPPAVTAWLLLLLWVWVTGGLHLDGLMDTADGLFSGRPPEQALAIMRDSRTGGMGVLAAILLLSGKWVLLAALLPARGGPPAASAWKGCLLLAPLWARWGMALALTSFPYRRKQGIASDFFAAPLKERRSSLGWATVFSLAVTAAVVGWAGGSWPWALAAGAAAVFTTAGLGARWQARFGGLTGDMYGALAEINEVLLLLVGAIFDGL